MKIYYQDRNALAQIEEPYKSALTIMMDLYIEGPEEQARLEYDKFLEFMAINCVRQICEEVKNNPTIYITLLCSCRDRLYQPGRPRRNAFEQGYMVGYPYEAATILGATYYVLATEGVLNEKQLSNVEKIATWIKGTGPYFKVFKDALKEKTTQQSFPNEATTSVDEKALTELTRERDKYKKIVNTMTDGNQKFLTDAQAAIFLYFLMDRANLQLNDNKLKWAGVMSVVTKRNAQNLREIWGHLVSDMEKYKKDLMTVADKIETANKDFADYIRNQL